MKKALLACSLLVLVAGVLAVALAPAPVAAVEVVQEVQAGGAFDDAEVAPGDILLANNCAIDCGNNGSIEKWTHATSIRNCCSQCASFCGTACEVHSSSGNTVTCNP